MWPDAGERGGRALQCAALAPTKLIEPERKSMNRLLLTCFFLACTGLANAQERFSIFVGSAQENVERMIRVADIRDDDVVMDLGSGDGRIVFTALAAVLLTINIRHKVRAGLRLSGV